MRLTLRTLLAYLDNVLDPNDAKVLQEKVAHGRLARGMVDRIQAVMSRPKLAAPKVDARGTSGDANVVAEYLDNTLSPQHVVDFEQACLGEDARLAEVAGCHQILSIVLAKPAVISPSLRNRIRQLGNSVQPPPVESDEAAFREPNEPAQEMDSIIERNGKYFRIDSAHRSLGSEPSVSAEAGIRSENLRPVATDGLELNDQLISHVPEYLRGGTKGDWTNPMIIFGLVAALVFVAWMSLGSLEDVRKLLHQNTVIVSKQANELVPPKPIEQDLKTIAQESLPIVQSNSAPPPNNPSDEAIVETIVTSEAPPIMASDVSRPPGIQVEDTIPATAVEMQEPPVDSSKSETIRSDSSLLVPGNGNLPSTKNSVEPKGVEPKIDSEISWQPETKESSRTPILACLAGNEGEREIRQLKTGESIAKNEKWIVPAAFRTEFQISPGIRWIVADESMMTTTTNEDSKTGAIFLHLGRAMVHATPDCQQLSLQSPVQSMLLHFHDTASIAAIELRYKRIVGLPIEQALALENGMPSSFMRPYLSVVCVAGECTLTIQNEEPLKLDVGQGVELSTDAPTHMITVREIPWWYRSSLQRPIDGDAAEDLSKQLADESKPESIIQRLKGITQGRRSETAALAMRTLFLLGEYSPWVGTDGILSNPTARPHRTVLLESFFQSLGVDKSHLSLLKGTIDVSDPSRASRLLALLFLPTNTQLADGADRVLVDSLSSPFLDERVLGIYGLNAIVGKEHGFQSDRRPSLESVQPWKQLLTSGKIRWPK